MCEYFSETFRETKEKVTICNEGGSRSSKTWDTIHMIYAICEKNKGRALDIYVLRETLVKCKDFTLKDFEKCMRMFDSTFTVFGRNGKPYIDLFGNNIYFRGLDDEGESEGYPSDILFFNEALEMKKSQVQGLVMRCRMLCVFDWNPKFTKHWCFDMEGGHNTLFTRSNYTNNKHLEKAIVRTLESYNPFDESEEVYVEDHKLMFNGLEVSDNNLPKPNLVNIESNSADLFRYKVYTLGLRGAMKGLIFPNVKYIDEFPDIAHSYGLDFGFTTDPCALVKYGQEGNNIYLELLSYTPMETEDVIVSYLEKIGIEKLTPITADSSDRYISEKRGVVEMVKGIRQSGYSCTKVSKTKSVMYWLLKMKTYKIHIIKNNFYTFAKTEQENYRMKEINGLEINQPNDDFNHFWDAARYAFMSYNTGSAIWG
jgi:phage terminase large subunit